MKAAYSRKLHLCLLLALLLLGCNLFSELTAPPQVTFQAISASQTSSPMPSATSTPTATATPIPSLPGHVWQDTTQANLFSLPSEESEILSTLAAGSPLTISARNQDYTWLQVTGPDDTRGWLPARSIELKACLDTLPPLHSEAGYQPQEPISLDLSGYPYLSGLCSRSREIFVQGQALGNRAEVFSKIGDSITFSTHYLAPFGRGEYQLDQYTELQNVIDHYSVVNARTGNSFINTSLSAGGGWSSWTVVNFYASDSNLCLPNEVPLECELRLVKPAVALIMLGTNDAADPDLITPPFYEENMRKIIETCIQRGVIPVLSTIPNLFYKDFGLRVPVLNLIIIKLADEYDIPLWDYHAALEGLPDSGLLFDGTHPSVAPNGAGDLSPAGLQSGMNMRNLTALQTLDAIWRGVIENQLQQ